MNRAEIEALYRKYGAFVLRRARAVLGDEAMAFDVMQEVFLRLVSGEDHLASQSAPLSWLYKTTTHRCLNLLRDAGTQARLLAQQAREESTAGSAERKLTVVQLLQALPAELQEIAVYYHVDQMDQAEIAALTGVSRRTIGNRLEEFKALARAAGER